MKEKLEGEWIYPENKNELPDVVNVNHRMSCSKFVLAYLKNKNGSFLTYVNFKILHKSDTEDIRGNIIRQDNVFIQTEMGSVRGIEDLICWANIEEKTFP